MKSFEGSRSNREEFEAALGGEIVGPVTDQNEALALYGCDKADFSAQLQNPFSTTLAPYEIDMGYFDSVDLYTQE